jgi:hypothetical protein
LNAYKNAYIDLGSSYFGINGVEKANKLKYLDKEYTIWDHFEIKNQLTLNMFLDLFKNEHQLTIVSVGCLQFKCIIYRARLVDPNNLDLEYVFIIVLNKSLKTSYNRKINFIFKIRISKIIEKISNSRIEEHVRILELQINCRDLSSNGKAFEIPPTKYYISK